MFDFSRFSNKDNDKAISSHFLMKIKLDHA